MGEVTNEKKEGDKSNLADGNSSCVGALEGILK